jgi:hypothetical protein
MASISITDFPSSSEKVSSESLMPKRFVSYASKDTLRRADGYLIGIMADSPTNVCMAYGREKAINEQLIDSIQIFSQCNGGPLSGQIIVAIEHR